MINQKGAAHLLLLIAGVGLLGFFLLTSFAPLKDNLLSSLFPKQFSHAAGPNDWAQVQKDPQRTGFTAETVGTNFTPVWTHPFQPERVNHIVQAIVYSGSVYVGTQQGNLYALDALTGNQRWKFTATGSILNSVAADNGVVYFGNLDGAVYAVNTANGTQKWKQQLSSRVGFSTAPLLADNKLMIGGQDGKFYGLDLNSGSKLWEYDAGAPILMTAAWNNGRVIFGSMDMFVHAVNSSNGTQAWKSPKIKGMGFRTYWPVIHQGKVIVRPVAKIQQDAGWPFDGFVRGLPVDNYLDDAQENQRLASYDANPSSYVKTFYVLNEATGAEMPAVIHWNYGQAMNGATAPPCVDKDGFLIVPAQKPEIYPNNFEVGWGKLDLTTRKITQGLFDSNDPTFFKGFSAPDENLSASCTGNGVFTIHVQEENAAFTGFFDQTQNKWYQFPSGATNKTLFNNFESGESNAGTISNGWMYHILAPHELVARKTK